MDVKLNIPNCKYKLEGGLNKLPNVELLGDDNPETKDIFAKLKEKFGEVPPPFRAMANHPEYLKIVMHKMETIMGSDALDQKTKLVIAFTVSTLNNCDFCINLYAQQLKNAGFTDKQFVELLAMVDLVGSMNHFNNGMMIKPHIESSGSNRVSREAW